MDRILRTAQHFTLPALKKMLSTELFYAGLPQPIHVPLGIANVSGLALVCIQALLAFFLDLSSTATLVMYATLPLTFFVPFFCAFFYYYYKAENRTKQVDTFLPDLLQMISAHLRSGMTPFEAVKLASEQDFGVLSTMLKEATKGAVGSTTFTDLLLDIPKTIRSDSLGRAFALFSSSIRSGGHVADLLVGLAHDIMDRQTLKKELVINTATNAMFIFFTIVVGTPILLAISIYFVDVVSSLQATTGGSTSGFGLAGLGGEIAVTAGFLTIFSYIILFVTGVLATLFIGSMIEGKPQMGLKWAPVVVIGSYLLFFAARFLITTFLGNPLA